MTLRPWTDKQVALLRSLAKRRLSSEVIAKRLNRTGNATRFKASTLRPQVKFRSINRTK